MTYVEVRMEPYEFQFAAIVGAQRQIHGLLKGLQDRFGAEKRSGWQMHIEGACGEMMCARVLGRYWAGSVDTFREGGDVGEIQVRTRKQHNDDLIVRPEDRPEDTFVLVTGVAPVFRIHGWIRGVDARVDAYWLKPNADPWAWFVPQSALQDHRLLALKRLRTPTLDPSGDWLLA